MTNGARRPPAELVSILIALFTLACSGEESSPAPSSPRAVEERSTEPATVTPEPERAAGVEDRPEPGGHEQASADPHGEPEPAPHAPDGTSSASPQGSEPAITVRDELDVESIVRRNHERMRAMRDAPVHVIPERNAREAGRRICEAVVPRRPPGTPVLLKPNLSGIDMMRRGIDNGVELRTTGVEFLRGIVQCLRARGHGEITITDAWSRAVERDRWLRETGIDRLIADEGVRFVGLWEERGADGAQSPMLAAPFPGARHLRDDLLVPRLVARHLRDGLYISVPRMKMHRYAVMTLSIKNTMGLVVMRGATEPGSRSDRLHSEIGPWLSRFRGDHVDDRDAYIRSLEIFAERLSDALEVELPDAVLIDGVPPVAGDGFRLIEPLDEGVAIGSINPIFADAVGMEWMGYLDNADLERELRHRTSPLLEEAARRFYGSTDVLHGVRVLGDDSFRRSPRVAHYVAFPGFEIGRPPRPAGELPWMARALVARRIAQAPVLDGQLDDPAWARAPVVRIDTDWRGRPAGPETLARLAWTPDALFFAFDCAYETLHIDEESPIDSELETLYRYDAVELFLDEAPASSGTYREIEVSPRGHFLDIAVDLSRRPRGDTSWSSGITVGTRIDREARRFLIEGRIPAAAFGRDRLSAGEWRANLYRIAGRSPRTFLARFPTYAERPNYHVPERFGWLRLVGER